ncbi:MAG: sigma-70 family RNA polymerase sigma factor [Caldilineaceae bacterium]
MRTIVVRQANRLTRRKRLTTVSIELASAIPALSSDLDRLMAQQELQESIQQVIASLPEQERQVTLLFYIGDYSQQEIADYRYAPRLNRQKSVSSAYLRLYLRRERMMQMVQDNLATTSSKDERFAQEVIEVIEATERDLSKLHALLERNPTGPGQR